MTSTFDLRPLTPAILTPATQERLRALTFPAYRHLLSLAPAPRHLTEGDTRIIQPIGVGAWVDDTPVGLALAELPLDDGGVAVGASTGGDMDPPELLSLYVHGDHRRRGVGGALLRALESTLRDRSQPTIETVYMTGRPGIDAFERVLARGGWDAPQRRAATLRFTPDQAAAMPWFDRVHLPSPPFEIFPWHRATADERAQAIRSHTASPWIPTLLEFWRHDRQGFDVVSSLGLRYHGELVGWMVNHRLAPDFVRFTCGFVREDLSRRGRLLPLLTESIKRLHDTPGLRCSLVTPNCFPSMVEFLERRCAPWADFFGETRGARKTLALAAPAESASTSIADPAPSCCSRSLP